MPSLRPFQTFRKPDKGFEAIILTLEKAFLNESLTCLFLRLCYYENSSSHTSVAKTWEINREKPACTTPK